jgi:sterol desaturase/sphingolipid hydroxylase (fatty acid hydroxylase superfamily)
VTGLAAGLATSMALVVRWWHNVDALTIGAIAFLVAVTFTIEAATGDQARRYFSRNAATDALYTLFYLGGFYSLFVSGPIARALTWGVAEYAPFLRLELARNLPVVVQAAAIIVLGDGVRYWVHRWAHANRYLWEFHRIHHSQDQLTPWTNFRAHFADFAVHSVALFGLALILGPAPAIWAPLSILMLWQSLLVHTGWNWSLGPIDRIIVSPRYHSIHHSIESQHFDRNFGMVFSFWDYLFRTAARDPQRPRAFGVPGPRMPESFFLQLIWPFLSLVRWRPHRTRAGAPTV